MAIGAAINTTGNVRPIAAGGLPGIHLTAIDDATDATTNIGAPATIDEAGFHWIKIPEGYKRCFPYLACDVGVTSVGTKPIVYVIGAYAAPVSNAMPSDTVFARLDAAASGGAGITLEFDNTNDLVNTTYQFGGLATLTGVDCLGAHYIGIGVKTAAATIGGTGTVRINVLLLD